MTSKRMTVVASASALAGFGLLLWLHAVISAQRRSGNPRGIREEFVASQGLELRDATGLTVGTLVNTEQLKSLILDTGLGFAKGEIYENRAMLSVGIVTADRATGIDVEIRDDGFAITGRREGNDSRFGGEWGYRSRAQHEHADIAKRLSMLFAHPEAAGKRSDDDDLIPSQDLQLRDRDGWQFAALGLRANGNPALAIADRDGTVRVMWTQSTEPVDANSWELAAYDKRGNMRADLELHPDRTPDLVIFADDIGTYYICDFKSGTLVPDVNHSDSRNALSWISPMQGRHTIPLGLFDNRNRKLWSAP